VKKTLNLLLDPNLDGGLIGDNFYQWFVGFSSFFFSAPHFNRSLNEKIRRYEYSQGLLLLSGSFRRYSSGNTVKIRKYHSIRTYEDFLVQREQVLKENKGKSGIYRFINKVTGKSYIGSAVNLSDRL